MESLWLSAGLPSAILGQYWQEMKLFHIILETHTLTFDQIISKVIISAYQNQKVPSPISAVLGTLAIGAELFLGAAGRATKVLILWTVGEARLGFFPFWSCSWEEEGSALGLQSLYFVLCPIKKPYEMLKITVASAVIGSKPYCPQNYFRAVIPTMVPANVSWLPLASSPNQWVDPSFSLYRRCLKKVQETFCVCNPEESRSPMGLRRMPIQKQLSSLYMGMYGCLSWKVPTFCGRAARKPHS